MQHNHSENTYTQRRIMVRNLIFAQMQDNHTDNAQTNFMNENVIGIQLRAVNQLQKGSMVAFLLAK